MPDNRPAWTDERVAELHANWTAGLSCSQMARELNTTRNAIIGKLNRMGLTEKKRAKPSKPKPVTRAYRRAYAALHEPLPKKPVIIDHVELPADQSNYAKSLAEIGPDQCRYPLNDPGPGFLFCGAETDGDCSWCRRHKRVVYSHTMSLADEERQRRRRHWMRVSKTVITTTTRVKLASSMDREEGAA